MFPCKDCLVKSVCNEKCNNIITDIHTLKRLIVEQNVCPDCGYPIKYIRRAKILHSQYSNFYQCQSCYVLYNYSENYMGHGKTAVLRNMNTKKWDIGG